MAQEQDAYLPEMAGIAPGNRTLGEKMSTPDLPETAARLGCGALLGLLVGCTLIVGTVSFYANSISQLAIVLALTVIACAGLGWRYGDRFFHSLHKWIRWFF